LQACVKAGFYEIGESANTQIGTQKLGELRTIVEAWPQLSAESRASTLATIGITDIQTLA
jgi:hypothetical protein